MNNKINELFDGSNHPLNEWNASKAQVYKDACNVISQSLAQLESQERYKRFLKKMKSDVDNFWSYLSELYVGINLYNLYKELSFYYKVNNKEIDFLIPPMKSGIEISSIQTDR